jgi:hypothetical protein
MLTPRTRWLLAVVSFSFGAYQVVCGRYVGCVLLAASAFLAYGYFKYGTVWLAFRAVSAGEIDKAAQLLQRVPRPASLAAQERGYYELASGFVCAARAQNQDAERHLRLALENQLRTDNDRALAEAVLAQLLIARDELADARALLARAAARSCRPAIAKRIQVLHDGLPRSG